MSQYQRDNGFPQRQSLREVIALGKEAIGWDKKWHLPAAKKLSSSKMHGLGFMSINEWGNGLQGILAGGYACLMLRDGKVAIVGMRCDPGIDTDKAFKGNAELGGEAFPQELRNHEARAGRCLRG